MSENACELCGSKGTETCFGVEMCENCRAKPEGTAGFRIEVDHNQKMGMAGEQFDTKVIHEVKIELAFEPAVELSAHFTQEHGGHKLVKIFKSEYQSGDSEFDDAIYIRDTHREATKKLLAREGAREAILALVGEHGEVKIESGQIRFGTRDLDTTDVDNYVLAVCSLARHIIASA